MTNNPLNDPQFDLQTKNPLNDPDFDIQPHLSMGEHLANALRSGLSGIESSAGGILAGPLGATGIEEKVAQELMPKNPDLLDKVINNIAYYGPQVIPAVYGGAPLLKGAYGLAKQTPRLLGNIIRGGPDISNIAAEASQKAGSVLNDLTEGLKPDQIQTKIMQHIAKNRENNAEPIKEGFNNITSLDSYGKVPITLSSKTKSALSRLTNDETIKNVTPQIQGKINNFYNNPNFNSAHDIQSDLGKAASRFYNSRHLNPANEDTAKAITDIRNNLKSDIVDSLKESGNRNIGNTYKLLQEAWKKQVVPYDEENPIYDYIHDQKEPANILTTLERKSPATDKIKQDLFKNPEQAKLLLGQHLTENLDKENLNLNSILKRLNTKPSYLDEAAKVSGREEHLQNLSDALNKIKESKEYSEKVSPYYKAARKYLGWGLAGAAAGLGLDITKDLL